MKNYHLEVLDRNQKRVLSKLNFLSQKGFYLAGGTALALQIGHRTSVDFDFYIQKHFDVRLLADKINQAFGDNARKTLEEKDTLFVNISGVDCSFFWYQYPLIERTKDIMMVKVASCQDIAAMKLIAISHRPVKRDYIDIYYLLEKFSLKEMFSFVKRKYPNFNQYFAFRALTYFEDIGERENKRPIKVLNKNFSWEKAKDKITDEVRKSQLSMLKK